MWKTLILPTDEKKLARKLFVEFVRDEPYALLVVFGKGEETEALVRRASKLAGKKNDPRYVIWARKRDHIAEDIAALKGGDQVGDTALGIAISMADKVCDVIKETDDTDFSRLFDAFASTE
ncbi:MAG: hypothetical protein NXI31_02285 [bacterium]|nr:hypothetical protein [bacterium]